MAYPELSVAVWMRSVIGRTDNSTGMGFPVARFFTGLISKVAAVVPLRL